MELIHPADAHLPGYVAALRSGWSADNERGRIAAQEELESLTFRASSATRRASWPR